MATEQTKAPTQAERVDALEAGQADISSKIDALLGKMDARSSPSGSRRFPDAIDIGDGISISRQGDPVDFVIPDYDVGSDPFHEFVENEAFYHEPVMVSVPPQKEPHDFPLLPVSVNGRYYPMVRGRLNRVPRLVVEQLLRSGKASYTCDIDAGYNPRVPGGFMYHETFSPDHAVTIVEDTPQGRKWAAMVVEQERQSHRRLA